MSGHCRDQPTTTVSPASSFFSVCWLLCMLEAVLKATWIFFALPTSHTDHQIFILPLAAKAWAKEWKKDNFQAETQVSSWCLLIPAAQYLPLIDRYLLVYGPHLKLVVSKKFYADCFGSEPGLRRVVFLPTSSWPLSQEAHHSFEKHYYNY